MSPIFLSSSFSKSLSLYGERVGAFSLVAGSADEAARALSQVKRVVRTNYSNPPTHGGDIVARVLDAPELRALWEKELGGMRERIKAMRQALAEGVQQRVPGSDWSFVLKQRGLFSYTGLTQAQVERLRTEYSIHAIDTGRVCVAALNSGNIDYVADAIAKVIR
jgi:aromatic-amino-acid transaminase